MVTIFYKTSSKCKNVYNAVTNIESNDVCNDVWEDTSKEKIMYRKDNMDESKWIRTSKGNNIIRETTINEKIDGKESIISSL
jgi:hypothetical protein